MSNSATSLMIAFGLCLPFGEMGAFAQADPVRAICGERHPGHLASGCEHRPTMAAPGSTAYPPLWTDPDSAGFVGCGKMLLGEGWPGPWDGPLSFQPPGVDGPLTLPPFPPGAGAGGQGLGDRGPGNPFDPTDVLHNNLDIEIVPSSSNITGSNTMTIRVTPAAGGAGLGSFTFRLRSNYTVTQCTVTDGQGSYDVTPTLPPINNTSYGRTITLARPVAVGETFTLRVAYTGTAQTVAGSSIVFGTQNGQPLVWTLSEPYYAATWWPCKDGDVRQAGDNSDKATLTFSITAPSALRSVANGVLTGTQTLTGGRTKYTWSSSYPMPTYLVAFSSTVYNTWTAPYSHAGGTMTAEFNIYPASDTANNRAAWQRSLEMMAAFRGVFGEYPFVNEKYGIYQFGFSGGMEHQTNSGQGGFGESLTAHELMHQWWGDWVTCKTWHDIWLNEGLATYGEAVWQERKSGSTGLPALRSAMNARRPGSVDGTVWNPDVTSINRIFSNDFTYLKAGWVFHQLRRVLGDGAFYELLALHRETHGGGAAGTDDFTALASATAGRDLNWFFQPWLFQNGAPAYEAGWQNVTINGRSYVRLRVRQTQSAAYPAFTMPIDVRLDGAAGGGASARVRIYNDGGEGTLDQGTRVQHFLIPTEAAATGVTLDENDWILTLGKTAAAYIGGPAKIAESSVAPDTVVPLLAAPSQFTVVFSDGVTASAADVELRRAPTASTPNEVIPLTFAYNPATATMTLGTASGAPLRTDAYVLTIRESVRTAGNSLRLDGELPGTWAWTPIEGGSGHSPAPALPSGNGIAGGDARLAFTVAAAECTADWNSLSGADADDIFAFLGDWFEQLSTAGTPAGAPHYRSADVDGSGVVDADDVFAFLNLWFAGCG